MLELLSDISFSLICWLTLVLVAAAAMAFLLAPAYCDSRLLFYAFFRVPNPALPTFGLRLN